MGRKMMWGFLLVFVGILVCVIGIANPYRLGTALLVVLSLFLVAPGVTILTRAKYEGRPMDWSSLSLDVPYEINLFQTGKFLICINVSKHFYDNRVLAFVGIIPVGSTHLKVVKTNNVSLGIAFLSVKPEEVLITGGHDL